MKNLWLLLLMYPINSCKTESKIDGIGLFEFPADASVVVGDSIKQLNIDEFRLPALCYWLDSTKCTPCEYDMLYNFDPYFNLAGDISFFVLVSPPAVQKHNIDYKASVNNLTFPVIVDKDGSFYNKNKTIGLGENDFAYIYIDENGKGYEYVLPGEQMVYDIRRVFEYCTKNH